MKLIYRISTTIFCIVFITALILSSYSFYIQRSLINSQLVKKGHVLARLLSTSVVNYLISYDFYAIKMLMDPITKDSDILSATFFQCSSLWGIVFLREEELFHFTGRLIRGGLFDGYIEAMEIY